MNINVVTVRSGWILQKIAERIVEAGSKSHFHDWTLSHNPRPHAEVNFYCDVQNCYVGPVGSSKHIGLFTHVHANDPATVQRSATTLDYIFHMAPRYMVMFNRQFDYPNDRMDIMVPFEPKWAPVLPVIGVFQRGRHEGKGFNFLLSFVKKYKKLCGAFEWHFVGNGWQEVVGELRTLGAQAITFSDSEIGYPFGYETLYQNVDYVLVPSLWEGGPMSALEAACAGKHLIAANVGWCDAWADDLFTPGDTEGLAEILRSKNKLPRFNKLKRLINYDRCARQIIEAYKKVR